MSRVDDLIEHFHAPEFICPFAKEVRKHFLAIDALGSVAAMQSASDIAAGEALIVYATENERDFVAAGEWCSGTLKTFCDHIGATHNGGSSPFVDAGFAKFYTLGMGPQYLQTHPRWAPHLCLVFVNEGHVRAVPLAAREPIRDRMVARAGCIYDADNVWQPVCPRPKPLIKENE